LRDQLGARFQSIQIYSSNPLLPWELMRPSRANGAEERDFLGVEFRMARWHLSQGGTQLERPPQTMPLQELAVIAPQYTGVLFLPNQASEIQALQLVAGYRRVPGQLALVQGLFAHVPAGIVHFSGHGVVQEKSKGIFEYAIRLEDVELDLLTWRGLASQQPQEHPFIFFNACDIGQAHRVANFVSGWAPAMLEAGASGYIGGLWSLGDKGAATFAAHFYQRLQQELAHGPVTVAEVIREARRLVYTDGDPTFLAYVYYGDPNFQFMRRP
jgi:CHAT domain-containing protein